MSTVLDNPAESLRERYERVRATSLALVTELRPEDTVIQSMPDVSPTKWHLAHVTWFLTRSGKCIHDRSAARFRGQRSRRFSITGLTSTSRWRASLMAGESTM
jgi:hypothetical protein